MIRNLALLAVRLLVGILMLEGACRLVVDLPSPYVNRPDLVVQDRRGFWILRPGYAGVMDNRVDFRGRPVTVGADGGRTVSCRGAGTGRILILGDSQTFGQGLSDAETWPSLVQCRLAAAGNAPRVFNLAVPGVNIDSYASRLTQILPTLTTADRVIVGVTWNDLHTQQTDSDIASAARNIEAAMALPRAAALFAEPSVPHRFLYPDTWRYRTYRETGLFIPRVDDVKAVAESMLYASALYGLAYPRAKELFYRLRPTGAVFAKIPTGTFDSNFRLMETMRDAVEAKGARFDVILLPNRLFFDATYYRAYSQNGRVFPEQDYPGHLARKHCPSRRLNCVSMFPYLRTADRDAHTFRFDGHYNPAGARRIADGVFERLIAPGR